MTGEEIKLRIACRVDYLGRAYYVERATRRRFGTTRWENVGDTIGYDTEEEAKRFAEDYAKGDWISDSATFPAKPDP